MANRSWILPSQDNLLATSNFGQWVDSGAPAGLPAMKSVFTQEKLKSVYKEGLSRCAQPVRETLLQRQQWKSVRIRETHHLQDHLERAARKRSYPEVSVCYGAGCREEDRAVCLVVVRRLHTVCLDVRQKLLPEGALGCPCLVAAHLTHCCDDALRRQYRSSQTRMLSQGAPFFSMVPQGGKSGGHNKVLMRSATAMLSGTFQESDA